MMFLIGKLQALFILLPTSKGQFSDYSSSEILDSVSTSNEKYLRDLTLKYARSSKRLPAQIGDSKCTCICKRCKSKYTNKTKKCCKCTNCDDDILPHNKIPQDKYDPNTNYNLNPGDPGESQSVLMVPYPMPYPVPILLAPAPNATGPFPGPEPGPEPKHEAPTESPDLITHPPEEQQKITEVETTSPPKPIQAMRSGDIKKNLDIFCNEYGNCFKSFSNPSTKTVLDLERRKLEISNNIRPTISVNNIRVPMGKRYGLIELPEGVAENLRPTKKQR